MIWNQEIIKIKRAFEEENIDFVFLKGLPLHLYYEKTHPKRIYADCDVLINKKDFLEAEKIIIKFGYKKNVAEKKPDVQKPLTSDNFNKNIHNDNLTLVNNELKMVLDAFKGSELDTC
jgi:hypothetical protein